MSLQTIEIAPCECGAPAHVHIRISDGLRCVICQQCGRRDDQKSDWRETEEAAIAAWDARRAARKAEAAAAKRRSARRKRAAQ